MNSENNEKIKCKNNENNDTERKKEILERTVKIEKAVIAAGMIAVVVALLYLLIKFM